MQTTDCTHNCYCAAGTCTKVSNSDGCGVLDAKSGWSTCENNQTCINSN